MEVQRIAVVRGDGVGPEVTAEAVKALKAATADSELRLEFEYFPWGCEYYMTNGRMMPDDGLDTLGRFDQILLGAVGWPTVPDHVSLWGLLLPIRRGFQQYVNRRPTQRFRGVKSPLKGETPFRFTVIRENTEGEYSRIGGSLHQGQPQELAVQVTVFTRTGTERIIRYAFDVAEGSRKRVVGATKSNGIDHVMPYWDDVFRTVASDYPDVDASLMHADALAARMILFAPEDFDVIVASNLLGDILSEVGAAIQGSIGMAASANINPDPTVPCMFEPVHGSAPDIAGQGIANPIGAIWSAQMLLEHIGLDVEASRLLSAIEATVERGEVTPDLGGSATTSEVGDAIERDVLKAAR